MAMGILLNGDVLYKKSSDMTLLHGVDGKEVEEILEEVHEGAFGTHASEPNMVRKILRSEYYWAKMEANCCEQVKRCHKCQIYADNIQVPPAPLNVLLAPWPFDMWGIDVIGPINPKASNGHHFILVAIDYFTKWVGVPSYPSVTKKVVIKFIKSNIIYRYGIPSRIIMDNGTNLNNKMMVELCEQFKINRHNSTAYRPKANGAVEAPNKNIKKIVQKMVVRYKDWHEMLLFSLHGYRTIVRTSIEATPYSLVYGMEAILSIELEIPLLRIVMEAKLEEAEWMQTHFDQLNLIEEKRLEGDLVSKKIILTQKDPRGKWTPDYEGAYIVKRTFSRGAMIATNMDGINLQHSVNSDAVKKFYP
ncbi:Retrovirus-related Pol polyprotein, partial [Mucuna pruriens]